MFTKLQMYCQLPHIAKLWPWNLECQNFKLQVKVLDKMLELKQTNHN